MLAIEFFKRSIDSGQSYLRTRFDLFSLEFLSKRIDSELNRIIEEMTNGPINPGEESEE